MEKENLAHEYAHSIFRAIQAVEALENNVLDINSREDVETVGRDHWISEYDDTFTATLLNMFDELEEISSDFGGFVNAYLADPLDIECTYGTDKEKRQVKHVLTVGGPYAEISARGDDWVLVHVAWGGDVVNMSVEAPCVAESLFDSWDVFA